MSEDVVVKMGAETAEMLRAWKVLERSMDNAARKAEEFGQKGKKATSEFDKGMAGLAGRYASATAAIDGVTRAIGFAIEANRKFLADSKTAALSIDEQFRRFRVQARMYEDGPAADAAERSIQRSATRAAVTFDQANDAALQLVSGGFKTEDVLQGGGLDAMLDTMNALNAAGKGVDPRQLVRSGGMFLKATGQDVNVENLRGLGVDLAGLGATDLELPDLESLAKEASTITNLGRMAPDDILSTFATLRDTLPAPDAATQFRNTVIGLTTAGGTKKATAALEGLGMTPEDVDLVGETLPQALARLRQGLDTVGQAEQVIAMKQIFGRENLAGPLELMGKPETLAEYRGLLGDEENFNRLTKLATEGPAAEQRRRDEQERFQLAEGDGAAVAAAASDRRLHLRRMGVNPAGVAAADLVGEQAAAMGAPRVVADFAGRAAASGFDPANVIHATLLDIRDLLRGPQKIRILHDATGQQQIGVPAAKELE